MIALLESTVGRRDPLLIEQSPASKGFRPGANSFDDRAYLRCLLS